LLALVIAWAPASADAFDLQGHRGARGLVPENTLAAFATALSIGVTTLELDLGLSRDNVVMVAHDTALNPNITRDPAGQWLEAPGPALRELAAAEIQTYDVGQIRPNSRYAERFPAQKPVDGAAIPTFAEVVAQPKRAGNDAIRFNVETKLSPTEPELTAAPEAFAAAVIEAVRAAGIAERTTIQSFDWRTLRAVQATVPEIPTACLTAEQRWLNNLERGQPGASPWTAGFDLDDYDGTPALVAAAGCTIWSPYFRDLAPADLVAAKKLGLVIIVWTVNDPADMADLIEMGVDGIISDYPDRLRQVLIDRDMPVPEPTPVSP
jgi:glycerophosphoryl diester phosphodiesterase